MPILKKLIKVGNSVAVVLPSQWLRYYGLKEGDEILMEINDAIVIKPKR